MSARSALVIVDVQAGFINNNTVDVPTNLRQLLERVQFLSVIFTTFRNVPDSPFRRFLSWSCLSTPEQIAIVPELRSFASAIVEKTGYSPKLSALVTPLKEASIDTVYVAGIDTDVCVLITAAALFDAGYHVMVLADMSMSYGGRQSHDAALTILPRIIGADNVIKNSEEHFTFRASLFTQE